MDPVITTEGKELTAPAVKLKTLSRTEKQAIILNALMKEGYSQSEVATLIEVSRNRVHTVHKKVQTGVLNPLVHKAKKSVKDLLEGKPVGAMREVRGSDVLTAAKMVLDRVDPVTVKTENTNISMAFELTSEDRHRYKNLLGVIDAEFTALPNEPQLLIEGKVQDAKTTSGSQQDTAEDS